MESWEQRALDESKTPKISNCGGSVTKKKQHSAAKHRVTHRRPPRPNRPKQGGLGSSILEQARRTPKRDRSNGISLRPSPNTRLSDRFAQVASSLNPKVERSPPAIPRQHAVSQSSPEGQSSISAKASNTSDTHGSRSFPRDTQQQSHHVVQKRPTSATTSEFVLAAESTTLKFSATDPVSHTSIKDGAAGSERNVEETKITSIHLLSRVDATENNSDDDMNCDSSDESLLSSSDSSQEVPIEDREPVTDRDNPEEEKAQRWPHGPDRKQDQASGQNRENYDPVEAIFAARGRKQGHHIRARETYGTKWERNFLLTAHTGPTSIKSERTSRLLGATIGTHRFALEDLQDDTDVTDVTAMSGDDGNTTDTSCEEESTSDTDEDASDQIPSSFHGRELDKSLGGVERGQKEPEISLAARHLDCIPSPASDGIESANSHESDVGDEQSYEGWSIDGYTNSPILFTIDRKTYVHPPLPAGWRIKISKTHKRPIYIHPDIGRTFHCPVNLPQNVVYVRTKYGTLEKRNKEESEVDPDSPQSVDSPETPQSEQGELHRSQSESGTSTGLSSHTSSHRNPESQSSKSTLDSTSIFIREAMEQSEAVLNQSSKTLQEALSMVKNKQQTPSTMSDLVRFYQRDNPTDSRSETFRYCHKKDGYDCDVSDCGKSLESSSSFRSVQSLCKKKGPNGYRKQTSNSADALNPLTTVTELGDSQEDRVVPRAPQAGEMASLENWFTPDTNPASNQLVAQGKHPHDAVPDYATWKEGISGTNHSVDHNFVEHERTTLSNPRIENSRAGEYIDGWFTPHVGIKTTVATMRHNSERKTATKAEPHEASFLIARGSGDIHTTGEAHSFEHMNTTALLPSQSDQFSVSDTLKLKNDEVAPPLEVEKKALEKGTAAKNGDSTLLPFFDVFQQHLADGDDTSYGDSDENVFQGASRVKQCFEQAEKSNVQTIERATNGQFEANTFYTPVNTDPPEGESKSSKRHQRKELASENSIDESEEKRNPTTIKMPSDTEPTTIPRKESVSDGHVSVQDLESQLSDTAGDIDLESNTFPTASTVAQGGPKRGKNLESISVDGNQESAQQPNMKTPLAAEKQNFVSKPSSTSLFQPLINSKTSTLQYYDGKPGETASDSPIQFDNLPDASPETPKDATPIPGRKTSPNERGLGGSNSPRKVDDPERRDSVEQTGFSDDDQSTDIMILQPDETSDVEGGGIELESASSSSYITVKRRRMSWRVLNPTYPLCSLQRLDEIALQQKTKRRRSMSKSKKRKKAKTGSRTAKSRAKTSRGRSRE
ncbi:MAG: hypothetical protein SGILL_002407 [Bacillariaceae sp.]